MIIVGIYTSVSDVIRMVYLRGMYDESGIWVLYMGIDCSIGSVEKYNPIGNHTW